MITLILEDDLADYFLRDYTDFACDSTDLGW